MLKIWDCWWPNFLCLNLVSKIQRIWPQNFVLSLSLSWAMTVKCIWVMTHLKWSMLLDSDGFHSSTSSSSFTIQGIATLKIPLDFPCIRSLKVRSRLVFGEDSLSRYFFFFLLLLRVRHEIENLREKSSIQMAFSKRQKTVKVWLFLNRFKADKLGPWHNGIWVEFHEEVFNATEGRVETSWDRCYQWSQELKGWSNKSFNPIHF